MRGRRKPPPPLGAEPSAKQPKSDITVQIGHKEQSGHLRHLMVAGFLRRARAYDCRGYDGAGYRDSVPHRIVWH